MTSYKKVVKELPEFELVIDKRNQISMGTTLETSINWRGPAEIVIKEEKENAFNLSVIRSGCTVFNNTFETEEEATYIMFQKVDDLRLAVELECMFTL
ncbi:hypothetical protein MZM54_02620 [[Brevibacterium] frigoritolerans]|nr:hypothetical protein [Peribacillus frigoritolerans]